MSDILFILPYWNKQEVIEKLIAELTIVSQVKHTGHWIFGKVSSFGSSHAHYTHNRRPRFWLVERGSCGFWLVKRGSRGFWLVHWLWVGGARVVIAGLVCLVWYNGHGQGAARTPGTCIVWVWGTEYISTWKNLGSKVLLVVASNVVKSMGSHLDHFTH